MREILFWLLLCSTVCGQFEYAQDKPANLGQAIGQGAVDELADSPKIVIETIPGCPACDRWIETDGVDLLKAGWTIKPDKLPFPMEGRTYPRWKVCLKDGCTPIDNLPSGQFKAALQRILDKRKNLLSAPGR